MSAARGTFLRPSECAICGQGPTTRYGVVGAFLCDRWDCFSAAWGRVFGGESA